MAKTEKMTRLNFSIPVDLHRKIKAAASLEGKSMRDYVLERVLRDDSEFDCENVNDAIADGLKDVLKTKKGEIELPSYKEFLQGLS